MKLFSDSLPFFRANFHCHTTRSDGGLDPESAVGFYRNAGYDILSVTDHRTVTEAGGDRPLLIPGIEIDYALPGQAVHILGLGMRREIGALWDRSGTPQDGINLIRSLGGIAVLAHPAWSLNTPAFIRSLSGLSGVEIWNSVSTLPLNGERADSSSLLDVTWASVGTLMPVFANDDSHAYRDEAGVAATMVQAEALTVAGILSALKAGRFYATQGPEIHDIEIEGDRITVACSPVSRITFCSNLYWVDGRCRCGEGLTGETYRIQPGERFVRVQLTDADGRKAWSSPIVV
jgi:hypothetical protein